MDFEVQTRAANGAIMTFPTLEKAMEYSTRQFQDNFVWKISFSLPTGERVRLVREIVYIGDNPWKYEPIDLDANKAP